MADDNDVDEIGRRVDKAVEMAVGRLRENFSKATVENTEDRMREMRREIEDMIHTTHSGDKAEREELKAELAKVNQFLDDLRKSKDKKEDSGATIVVPASEIDQHRPQDEPTAAHVEDEEPPKRSGLKKWW